MKQKTKISVSILQRLLVHLLDCLCFECIVNGRFTSTQNTTEITKRTILCIPLMVLFTMILSNFTFVHVWLAACLFPYAKQSWTTNSIYQTQIEAPQFTHSFLLIDLFIVCVCVRFTDGDDLVWKNCCNQPMEQCIHVKFGNFRNEISLYFDVTFQQWGFLDLRQ